MKLFFLPEKILHILISATPAKKFFLIGGGAVGFGILPILGLTLLTTFHTNKIPYVADSYTASAVLAAQTEDPNFIFNVNVPSFFNDTVTFGNDAEIKGGLTVRGKAVFGNGLDLGGSDLDVGAGKVIASNLVYSVSAGDGISIAGNQTPTITNTGVLSLQGKSGKLDLVAGDGITIDGLKISSTSTSNAQNVFKTIAVSGQSDVTAGSATDTLTFAQGTGITLTTDPTTKKLTIAASGGGVSGLTSLDGLTGTVTIANTSGSGSTITIDDASTSSKGIASFNSTNFSVSSGAVTLVQNINTSASPTFTGLTLSSLTTNGGLVYTNGSGSVSQLSAGTSGYVLTSNGAGAAPSWIALSVTDRWQENLGAISPKNITDALNLGNIATSSALTHLAATVGDKSFFMAGNVGIGTTNPLDVFEVNGNIRSSDGTFVAQLKGDSGGPRIQFGDTGDVTSLMLVGAYNGVNNIDSKGRDLRIFNTNDTTGLTFLASNGNFGIGSTTPSEKLDLNGRLYLSNTSAPGVTTNRLYANSGNLYWAGTQLNGVTSSQWTTSGSNIYYTTGGVGIGTTSPLGFLNVHGGSIGKALSILNQTGDQDIFTASTSGSTKFVINNSGNVGLGTTNPAALFSIQGTTQANLSATSGSTAVAGALMTSAYGASGGVLPGLVWSTSDNNATKPKAGIWTTVDNSGSHMYFGTSNVFGTGITNSGLIIDPAGGIGLGVTDAQNSRVHLYGGSGVLLRLGNPLSNVNDTSDIAFGSNNSTDWAKIGSIVEGSGDVGLAFYTTTNSGSTTPERLRINNMGNIGIGTTDPLGLFHVSGSAIGKSLVILNQLSDQDIFTASSSGVTRFVIANNGNIGIGTTNTSNPLTVGYDGTNGNGAYVTTGGAWTNGSSRDFKENFTTVNSDDVLSKINSLTIQQWNYKNEGSNIKHIGPIAEDFYNTFNVGNDNKHISTIDPAGVALIGIQALSKQVEDLKAQIMTSSVSATFAPTTASLGISDENATLSGDLTVSGRTTVNDLGVTGKLVSGLMAVDGAEGSINVVGDLKLQANGYGKVDFFAGKVTFDKNGNMKTEGAVTAKSVETGKVVITAEKSETSVLSASAGKITIPSGQTSVDIKTTALTVDSLLFVTPEEPVSIGSKKKDAQTFTIKLESAQSSDLKVNWWIVDSKEK